jgi:hypothetical protein
MPSVPKHFFLLKSFATFSISVELKTKGLLGFGSSTSLDSKLE